MKRTWAGLCACLLTLGMTAAPASAAEEPDTLLPITNVTLVTHKQKVLRDITKYSRPIARCRERGGQVGCTITTTMAVQRTIGTEFGITRGVVAASLKIEMGWTESVSISCVARDLKKGQELFAWPRGDQHQYKITRVNQHGTKVSGWKFAFDPNGWVECGVQ